MEILIVLDLPEKIDKLVDEKRAIYYPRIVSRLEPHLTIKEPSRVLTDFKIIEKKLEKISAEFDPISIKIEGLGHFGQRVIFWKILDNPELFNLEAEIEKNLKNDLTNKDRYHQYTPHITILSRAKRGQFRETMEALKKENYRPKLNFICDTLIILENLQDQPGWKKIKSFRFGK